MTASNIDVVSNFIGETNNRALNSTIADLAKRCLVDWFSVSLAALPDTASILVRRQMQQWGTSGRARSLYGDIGAPGAMALVNGTLSHSLDFDDMHFDTAFHASGPTFAAALAIGMDRGSTGKEILNAFVAGYEAGATLGGHGVGPRLITAGWHSTSVLGHFSSACAASVLLQLNPKQIAHALGLAATQAGGLQASGGTMAKPYHVGKAAMNGVLAAEQALLGMDANTGFLDDPKNGLIGCFLQTPHLPRFQNLGQSWEIDGNTFKPYASCQLTHAPYEAARSMRDMFDVEKLREIRVYVNPLAKQVAGRERANSPMEAKFCIGHCVALGLLGHEADMDGFTEKRVFDAQIQRLAGITQIISSENIERWASIIELDNGEGNIRRGETQAVRGCPSRPLSWSDLEQKFFNLTTPILGNNASHLLQVLRNFDEQVSMVELTEIIDKASKSQPILANN